MDFSYTLLCVLVFFPACTTFQGQHSLSNVQKEIQQTRDTCSTLKNVELQSPILTDVSGQQKQIDKAIEAKQYQQASRLNQRLESACRLEIQQREDVVALAKELEATSQIKKNIDPEAVLRFTQDVQKSNYSGAIMCGQAILLGSPEKCTPAASTSETLPSIKYSKDQATNEQWLPQESIAEQSANTRNYWPWVLIGTGGTSVIIASILGALAKSNYDTLKSNCPTNCSQDEIDRGHNRAITADVFFTIGGIGITSGLLWYFLDARHAASSTSASTYSSLKAIKLSPYGLSIESTF